MWRLLSPFLSRSSNAHKSNARPRDPWHVRLRFPVYLCSTAVMSFGTLYAVRQAHIHLFDTTGHVSPGNLHRAVTTQLQQRVMQQGGKEKGEEIEKGEENKKQAAVSYADLWELLLWHALTTPSGKFDNTLFSRSDVPCRWEEARRVLRKVVENADQRSSWARLYRFSKPVSESDLLALAACVVLEELGGPSLKPLFGRKDCNSTEMTASFEESWQDHSCRFYRSICSYLPTRSSGRLSEEARENVLVNQNPFLRDMTFVWKVIAVVTDSRRYVSRSPPLTVEEFRVLVLRLLFPKFHNIAEKSVTTSHVPLPRVLRSDTLSVRDLVALLGGCRIINFAHTSSYVPKLIEEKRKNKTGELHGAFSNHYFMWLWKKSRLLEEFIGQRTQQNSTSESKIWSVWHDKPGNPEFFSFLKSQSLQSSPYGAELLLLSYALPRSWVEKFSRDEVSFFESFAAVFASLLARGIASDSLVEGYMKY